MGNATKCSWKPEFQVDGKWYDNAQRFATRAEAHESARARFAAWTVPTDYRVTESEDPVNYRWDAWDINLESAVQ